MSKKALHHFLLIHISEKSFRIFPRKVSRAVRSTPLFGDIPSEFNDTKFLFFTQNTSIWLGNAFVQYVRACYFTKNHGLPVPEFVNSKFCFLKWAYKFMLLIRRVSKSWIFWILWVSWVQKGNFMLVSFINFNLKNWTQNSQYSNTKNWWQELW